MQLGEAFAYEEFIVEYNAETESEPEVQVKIGRDNSPWHRPMIGTARTLVERGSPRGLVRMRCGFPLGETYYVTRDEETIEKSLEGNLCLDGCFGPHELEQAVELRRKQSVNRRADLDKAERDFLEDDRRRAEEKERASTRLKLATDRMARIERERIEREEAGETAADSAVDEEPKEE